jgi:DNA polymerase elongation subunit (family B)
MEYLFTTEGSGKLQGEKMYTPKEVDVYNLSIDYLYYLEKQVVSPLDEVLAMLGHVDYLKNFCKMCKNACK